MAQHIGVIKIDENGNTLYDPEINFAVISDFISKLPDFENKYPWLSSIDPYGDTLFNVLQSKHLIKEFQTLKMQYSKLDILEKLIDFFSTVASHEYVKFIGD